MALPADRNPLFGTHALADYQLSVQTVPPLTAERGGAPVHPGAEVRNDGTHVIPPQTVVAGLPTDTGMRFGILTVWEAAKDITVYRRSKSPTTASP